MIRVVKDLAITPLVRHGFVIVNEFGSVWHDSLFASDKDAWDYVITYWAKTYSKQEVVRKFRVMAGCMVLCVNEGH